MQYILPENYSAEDVCRLWVDPLKRDDINRLPFLMFPISRREVEKFILSQNFEATFPNLPFDFLDISNRSLPDSVFDLNSLPEFLSITSEVMGKTALNSTYTTFQNEGNLRFYMRALTLTDEEAPVAGKLTSYSNNSRVINYVDQQPIMINLELLLYNTYSSPWLEIFKKFLEYYLKKSLKDQNLGLQIYLPLAIGDAQQDNLIYQVFDCDLLSYVQGSRTSDLVRTRLNLVLKKKTRTKITVGTRENG